MKQQEENENTNQKSKKVQKKKLKCFMKHEQKCDDDYMMIV